MELVGLHELRSGTPRPLFGRTIECSGKVVLEHDNLTTVEDDRRPASSWVVRCCGREKLSNEWLFCHDAGAR